MKQNIEKLKSHRGMRYLLVGGSIYVLEVVIIIIAQSLGASSVQAVAMSFSIGLVVSFILQKLFTFGDRRMSHHIVLTQALAVMALVAFNFGFTVLVTKLFEDVFSPIFTRTFALGMTTVWNFYLYKTRIFTQYTKADDPIVG